jgi:ABC-2 type transport system ATP-binding protein
MEPHSLPPPVAARSQAPAIESIDLSKSYGETQAVQGLSLWVARGEVFGFLGPNGAGKTTTIRLLLGLQRPTSGRSAVLGLDSQGDAVELHRRVGYLPGELALYPRLTGRQHIDWFRRARGVDDGSLARSLVERFGVVVDRPMKQLSKGNRQKVGLVLAFMHRPELLILDEPTSGLDPLMQHEFEQLVGEVVADGRTVFLSSHELDEVQRLADRVAIIRSGGLVTLDTVAHLRERAPRTVEVRFSEPVDQSLFDGLEGVAVSELADRRVVLTSTGPIGPLLRVITEHDPVDLVSRPADLDELFLELYRDSPTPTEAAHAP